MDDIEHFYCQVPDEDGYNTAAEDWSEFRAYKDVPAKDLADHRKLTTKPSRALEGGNVQAFVLAGKANFWVESRRTGVAYPFFVKRSQPDLYFVVSDEFFLGTITRRQFRQSHKCPPAGEARAAAFAWFCREVLFGAGSNACRITHDGRCAVCQKGLDGADENRAGLHEACFGKP